MPVAPFRPLAQRVAEKTLIPKDSLTDALHFPALLKDAQTLQPQKAAPRKAPTGPQTSFWSPVKEPLPLQSQSAPPANTVTDGAAMVGRGTASADLVHSIAPTIRVISLSDQARAPQAPTNSLEAHRSEQPSRSDAGGASRDQPMTEAALRSHTFGFSELGLFGLHADESAAAAASLLSPTPALRNADLMGSGAAMIADDGTPRPRLGASLNVPNKSEWIVGGEVEPAGKTLERAPTRPSISDSVPFAGDAPSEAVHQGGDELEPLRGVAARFLPDVPTKNAPSPVHLVVSESDANLAISVRSSGTDGAEAQTIRGALERTAAEYEARLGKLHLNGAAVPAPANSRGGHRGNDSAR